jgi:hypothetical protein
MFIPSSGDSRIGRPWYDNGCDDAGDYGMTYTIVPSLAVQICDDCRFGERDRFALLMSYGHAARRAGYFVDVYRKNNPPFSENHPRVSYKNYIVPSH